MAAGSPAGEPFVMLNERVKAAGLRADEIGLLLNWRIGPSSGILSGRPGPEDGDRDRARLELCGR